MPWDCFTTNCLSLTSQGNGAYYLTGTYDNIALIPQEELSASQVPTNFDDSPEGTPVPVLCIQSQNKGPVPITLSDSTFIHGRAEVIVKDKLRKRYKDELGMVSPVDKDCLPIHLLVAYSVCQARHELTIFINALLKFSDVFNESLGQTQVISHCISTSDAAPIRQSSVRLPYAFREEAQPQVRDMLEQGVTQPSASLWASPIVLVKKKDGKYKYYIDYRKLKSITQKDAHPLPGIDNLKLTFIPMTERKQHSQLLMDYGSVFVCHLVSEMHVPPFNELLKLSLLVEPLIPACVTFMILLFLLTALNSDSNSSKSFALIRR